MELGKSAGLTAGDSWKKRYLQDVANGVENPFNDSDMYQFMTTLSNQNVDILAQLALTNNKIDALSSKMDLQEASMDHHMHEELESMVRQIKGIGSQYSGA